MHTQWPRHNTQFLALQMLPDGTGASKYGKPPSENSLSPQPYKQQGLQKNKHSCSCAVPCSPVQPTLWPCLVPLGMMFSPWFISTPQPEQAGAAFRGWDTSPAPTLQQLILPDICKNVRPHRFTLTSKHSTLSIYHLTVLTLVTSDFKN